MDSVIGHGQAVDLDWSHPGPEEHSFAAGWIRSEDQSHPERSFALSATFDPKAGKFGSVTPYAYVSNLDQYRRGSSHTANTLDVLVTWNVHSV